MHCLYTWGGFKNGQKNQDWCFLPERETIWALLLHAHYDVSAYLSMVDSITVCVHAEFFPYCLSHMRVILLENYTYGMHPGWNICKYIFY